MSFGNRNNSMPFNNNSNRAQADWNVQCPMKTSEQLAFDLEFTKWEKAFADWRRDFANHPDRKAYHEYEQKFLNVRQNLLSKKVELFGESSVTQKFETQLSAATMMAESILQKFSNPIVPGRGYGLNYNGMQPNSGGMLNNPSPLMSSSVFMGAAGGPGNWNQFDNKGRQANQFKWQSKPQTVTSHSPGYMNHPRRTQHSGDINAIPKLLGVDVNADYKLEEVTRKLEIARNTPGLLKISGAARRRYNILTKDKKEEEYTPYEKKFAEYFCYLRARRDEARHPKDKQNDEVEEDPICKSILENNQPTQNEEISASDLSKELI